MIQFLKYVGMSILVEPHPLQVERHNLVEAYYRRLTGDDEEVGVAVDQLLHGEGMIVL